MFFNFPTANKKDLSIMYQNILDEIREHAKILEISNVEFFKQKDGMRKFSYKNRTLSIEYPVNGAVGLAFNHVLEGSPVWFMLDVYDNTRDYEADITRKNGYRCYIRMKKKGIFHEPKRAKDQIKALVAFVETGKKPHPSLCLHGLDEDSAKPLQTFLERDLPSAYPEIKKVKVSDREGIKILAWTNEYCGGMNKIKSGLWHVVIMKYPLLKDEEMYEIFDQFKDDEVFDPGIYDTLHGKVYLDFIQEYSLKRFNHLGYEYLIQMLKESHMGYFD